jgi:UDPglucose 6-dehydrogenase
LKITVVGTGYVGLVSGVCFASLGHEVTCVDINQHKIDELNAGSVPIYEPELSDLLQSASNAEKLYFTTDLSEALSNTSVVIIAVGTPTNTVDGGADISQVEKVAEAIAKAKQGYLLVVTKSTVPVGTNEKIHKILSNHCEEGSFDVASNPEFLREGCAVRDFMEPDRIVVGSNSLSAKAMLDELYAPLVQRGYLLVHVGIETAELIKYASNGFLATKISFINDIASLCEKTGADVRDVANCIGLDKRIGPRFLRAGAGYGGSCFPKDTMALAKMGRDTGAPQNIVEAVIKSNELTKRRMVSKIVKLLGGSVEGRTIAFLGVTFKPETDDMRDAPSLTILPALSRMGAIIRAYDPVAEKQANEMLPFVSWHTNAYDATQGADLAVLLTEWQEFSRLDMQTIAKNMRTPKFADLRNFYPDTVLKEAGFDEYEYVGVDRH